METILLKMFCEKTLEALTVKVLQFANKDAIEANFVSEPKIKGNMFYFCMETEGNNLVD